jgi:hypothetical protein
VKISKPGSDVSSQNSVAKRLELEKVGIDFGNAMLTLYRFVLAKPVDLTFEMNSFNIRNAPY